MYEPNSLTGSLGELIKKSTRTFSSPIRFPPYSINQSECAYALGREFHRISKEYGQARLTELLDAIKTPVILMDGEAIDCFLKGLNGKMLKTEDGSNYCSKCRTLDCGYNDVLPF